ncbi:F(420)H(2) dehydrogenase subunit M [uncultured archaeon]|nr:F(420)H(2) dehydrogenase subunit M [uncultured archaeon]
MILAIIIIILLAVSLIVLFSRSRKTMNYVTVLHSLSIILIYSYLLLRFNLPISVLKNNYLMLDAFSIYEILIAGIIFLLAAIYAEGYIKSLIHEKEFNKTNIKLFYLSYNFLLFSMVLVFSSNNLALLWIFAEITTILSATLIVTLNAKENIVAAMKYVFITSTAMLFSFIGLIFLFAASKSVNGVSTLNWDVLFSISQQISPQLLFFSFIFMFIGFAAKSGIVPFHTWLPPSHSKAASDVSALLSGVVLNIGIYAIIRMYVLIAPTSMGPAASIILMIFGILTVAVASLSMLVRTNLKKLIAYSSVENMGFMLIGIALGNMFWVLYYILAHALVKALLFFSAGIIHRQSGSMKAGNIKDILKLQPLACFGLIIGSIAIIGTPLFPIFFPKFYILTSLAQSSLLLCLLVLFFLFVAAGSFIWLIINLTTFQGKEKIEKYRIYLSMKIPIIILIVILFILGVYFPQGLQNLLKIITLKLTGN